jgi:hypothetical protein
MGSPIYFGYDYYGMIIAFKLDLMETFQILNRIMCEKCELVILYEFILYVYIYTYDHMYIDSI